MRNVEKYFAVKISMLDTLIPRVRWFGKYPGAMPLCDSLRVHLQNDPDPSHNDMLYLTMFSLSLLKVCTETSVSRFFLSIFHEPSEQTNGYVHTRFYRVNTIPVERSVSQMFHERRITTTTATTDDDVKSTN